jgi:hypothetical protein
MVDQASVRDGAAAHASSHGADADTGVAKFLNDVGTLAELQANLAALNFEEAVRKATVPIGLIVLNLTVLAAGVTVALIGSAWLLASALRIHPGWAMIMTAGVAVAVAGLAAMFGMGRLRSSRDSFRPSREELRRNLIWLRAVLISRGSSYTRRDT